MTAMVLLAALQCAIIAAAPVTFKVGLGGRQKAPEGVHLTGSFQGWDPAATAMEDADMDQIFEVTLELPEGRYEFKFINGNTWEQAEEVPESCSELDSTHFNRYISVASDGAPEEVHVCFSACTPCGELPTCKQFNCAAGFALKPAMLEYPGDSQASCCDQLPNDLKGVVVRSAGWSDGNRAEFWMNGDLLYATGTRGLTVVELLPKSQTVILNKTFDTYSDSSELETYLSSVASGNLILMGAADEASTAFSSEAKDLVALCGGQLIQQIGYRSSYALIGQKANSPGQPLAEVLLPAGSGQAVAIARVEVPESFLELPFCDTAVAEPPMLGTLAEDGNLQLDAGAGCRYRVRETSDATECLEGSWLVVTGSSNALLMWNTLLMMLAPSEAGDQRTGRFGGAHLLDAVIEDGVIIHYTTVRSWLDTCEQSTAHGAVNETACRMTYAETLNNAPAHSPKRIRLTMFLSFYWARTGTALDLIETNQAWAAAKVNVLVQVVAWYIVCNGIKCDCCHRPNLVDLPEEEVVVLFQNEMAPVLERLGSFCAPTGRAAGHGCAVATNSFTTAGGSLGAMFSRFNALLTEALQTRKTPTLRYVDIYTLGASMPEETVNGHGTQILQLWTWQALLGGFCPSSTARPESQVQFEGPLCWKSSVTDLAECKSYSTYTGSTFWQCLNSQPCSLTVVSTQTLATTATTTMTSIAARFEPVDGGVGRACRGSSASDNSAQYFDVVSVPTLDECKELCTMKQECVGLEHSGSRCELWTRAEGIGASIPLDGFTCLRLVRNLPTSTILTVTTTNTISPYFVPVDGGTDRACRGGSTADNLPSNYYVVGGIYELADCQEACVQAQSCVGIEFSGGRCEVWTRPNGIQASIALGGFTCMRYSMENDAAQKRRLFLAPREQSGYYA